MKQRARGSHANRVKLPVLAAAFLLLVAAPALAQQISGAPGSPSATTT